MVPSLLPFWLKVAGYMNDAFFLNLVEIGLTLSEWACQDDDDRKFLNMDKGHLGILFAGVLGR